MSQISLNRFFYYNEIDSTQKEIWRRIEAETIEKGTVVIAEKQTRGIGTHGRVWHTDEENNIAFSFYIDLPINIKKLEGLTYEIAEIILEVFESLYKVKLDIKKPNDIVFNGKKLGGILTETKLVGETLKNLVIGIGVNTNQIEFVEDIKEIASSIKKEFGISVDNRFVIKEFLKRFEDRFEKRIGEN